MKAGGLISTLVFLLMDWFSPETVMLMAATVLDATAGTCHSQKHAQRCVHQSGTSGFHCNIRQRGPKASNARPLPPPEVTLHAAMPLRQMDPLAKEAAIA